MMTATLRAAKGVAARARNCEALDLVTLGELLSH
jgi:hypothetical protein